MQIIPDTTLQDVFSLCCLCVQHCHSADQMVCWHSMDSWMMQILVARWVGS